MSINIFYIAGPMSDIDENNYPAFNNAARLLRSVGFCVENPAEHDLPENADYNDYLKAGIKKLMNCTHIILLPGWQASHGAIIERTVAKLLNIKVIEWNDILQLAQSPLELMIRTRI